MANICKYCEEQCGDAEYCNDLCAHAFAIREKHIKRGVAEKPKSNTQVYEAKE